jgi:hypothetical protein
MTDGVHPATGDALLIVEGTRPVTAPDGAEALAGMQAAGVSVLEGRGEKDPAER